MKKGEPLKHGHGINGLDKDGWLGLARTAVLDLLDRHLAVAHAELEARLWEQGWHEPDTGRTARIQPHILTPAVRELTAHGDIAPVRHGTKGEQTVELLTPGDTAGRGSYIAKALRRKGMLYARFVRWSRDFGPPGEAVVRASLADVAKNGYTPMTDGFGPVGRLGAVRMPGPLDSGAWMFVTDPAADNLPLQNHALLIEVKNRRLTLYPRHKEVHQLLRKAAIAKRDLPDHVPVVPLLICRRAHPWLFWMARDLGFLVHETLRHYVTLPKEAETRHLEEVNTELALKDLRKVTATAVPRISKLFTRTLPKQARLAAARWGAVGGTLLEHYERLRDPKLKPWEQNAALNLLHEAASNAIAAAGIDDPLRDWALEPGEPE